MKQLIKVLTEEIIEQVKPRKVNIIRLEGIDSPIIYARICQNLQKSGKIDHLLPKLSREKYKDFQSKANPMWSQALEYLHCGSNETYQATPSEIYAEKSYVDFSNAITKWRNESATMSTGEGSSLVLLLGTEAAPDTGGLADTSYVISPKEILSSLSMDYSKWLSGILAKNAIDTPDCRKALNTLYRAIFSTTNTDLFTLSNFIDSLNGMEFTSPQELISYICGTLNRTWGIPSILDSKVVPKVQNLSKGELKRANIILDAIKFIDRSDDIPTKSFLDKLHLKFEKYANEKCIDGDSSFPQENPIFNNFADFENCVVDFMCGKEIAKNRSTLLQMDYAIINGIIGTKLPRITTDKAPVLTGEPVKAYSEMFLRTMTQFYMNYSTFPSSFVVRVDKVSLSDCVEEEKEESYSRICNFLGGILDFFNDACIENDGQILKFTYDSLDNIDPFDHSNFSVIRSSVKSTGKWGDPCKILFTITASNNEISHKYDYKWAFSPYSPWLNAFSYLANVLVREEDCYTLPTLVACENIADFLGCESEDEFYAQINQIQDVVLYDEHRKAIGRYFQGINLSALFDSVCDNFKDFSVQLTEHGLFYSLDNLRRLVQAYTKLMEAVHDECANLTDVQHEKLPLLINSFIITSNSDVVLNCNMSEVILPAYNPVVLEKIDAKQIFMRDGFTEIVRSKISGNIRDDKLLAKLDSLVQLSSITLGVDTIHQKGKNYLTCQNMWEYYGVYYGLNVEPNLLSGNSFGMSIVTDDEDATAMLKTTPMSNIIVRNVLDFVKTFPSRTDGITIAFVAPVDMQHIVAAIHAIAKHFDSNGVAATINIKFICLNSKKNSATYLRRWLDSYFADERAVKVNTYLCNMSLKNKSDVDALEPLLKHYDLCFNYNILESIDVEFGQTNEASFDKDQAKFPMTFTPDTISRTHGKSRKVNVSQFQFLASKSHTQASYVIGHPHSVTGNYRAYKTLALLETQESIIEISHRQCRWVVCIDPAVDRYMLEANNSKIIGFTTGEGSYGELNVTVSARKDILADIKKLLHNRIREKFANWDADRLQKAANFCVDELSKRMDGSRILKALNPYDYEIHSFLAYILTMQMLGISQDDDRFLVRSLISLDSYKHWFAEDDDLSKDNKRPDFMLIEIPNTPENLTPGARLKIDVKIIECKMGFRNDVHVEKAVTQLEKGLRTMSSNWNPTSAGTLHRYWLNQLYRAIIFSRIQMDDASAEYKIVREKIYEILNGNFDIEWTGDVFAFWLDVKNDTPSEWDISSSISLEMKNDGSVLNSLVCHECGQMFIQKMLMPPSERESQFDYNNIEEPDLADCADESEEPGVSADAEEVRLTGTSITQNSDTQGQFASATYESSSREVITEQPLSHTENVRVSETNYESAPEIKDDEGQYNVMPETELEISQVLPDRKLPLSDVRLLIGEDLRTKEKYYWEFGNKELNNRHLLINGNSGCGKTYCIQTLLMEAATQGISSVVFDYTGGFTNSKLDPIFKEQLGDRIEQRFVRTSKIPVNPFAKHEIQLDDDLFVPEDDVDVASKIAEIFSTVYSLGDQQKSAVYSAVLTGMKKHGEFMSFAYMTEELEELGTSYAKTVLSKTQAFSDINPFTTQEQFDWGDIRDSDGTVYVIQLMGYGRDIQILLTELLLWDIWSFCVKTGDESKPFVLVLDEAQNLSHGDKSPSAKILTEGRKFGVSGWYATQFMKPQLSDDEIQRLQQAGQKLYFCPPDDGVMTVAKNIDITTQGAKDWSEKLKKLKKGECVTCGNMVRNGRFSKYEPRIVKVTSLQERITND